MLRTSPSTVRYWRHVSKGPASVKVGRRVLHERSDVEQWIPRLARGRGAEPLLLRNVGQPGTSSRNYTDAVCGHE